VFFVCSADGDRTRVVPLLAELRRRGLRAELDYGRRSVKGQLTQAGRLGAGWTVIVDGTNAVVREAGKTDWETPLDGLVERITG
jgi:histidyl-tRNA synthetase